MSPCLPWRLHPMQWTRANRADSREFPSIKPAVKPAAQTVVEPAARSASTSRNHQRKRLLCETRLLKKCDRVEEPVLALCGSMAAVVFLTTLSVIRETKNAQAMRMPARASAESKNLSAMTTLALCTAFRRVSNAMLFRKKNMFEETRPCW